MNAGQSGTTGNTGSTGLTGETGGTGVLLGSLRVPECASCTVQEVLGRVNPVKMMAQMQGSHSH